MYLYTDDTKVYRNIRSQIDKEHLQEDIICMRDWSKKWLLSFHSKYKYMWTGKCDTGNEGCYMEVPMEEVTSEKDAGAMIDSKLGFSECLAQRINKAHGIMRIINLSFTDSMHLLFVCLCGGAHFWRLVLDEHVHSGFRQ